MGRFVLSVSLFLTTVFIISLLHPDGSFAQTCTFVGCFRENLTSNATRALSNGPFVNALMTPVLCRQLCSSNTTFVGIHNGTRCYCGPPNHARWGAVSNATCVRTCPGAPGLTCGSTIVGVAVSNSIYSCTPTPAPTPVPTPATRAPTPAPTPVAAPTPTRTPFPTPPPVTSPNTGPSSGTPNTPGNIDTEGSATVSSDSDMTAIIAAVVVVVIVLIACVVIVVVVVVYRRRKAREEDRKLPPGALELSAHNKDTTPRGSLAGDNSNYGRLGEVRPEAISSNNPNLRTSTNNVYGSASASLMFAQQSTPSPTVYGTASMVAPAPSLQKTASFLQPPSAQKTPQYGDTPSVVQQVEGSSSPNLYGQLSAVSRMSVGPQPTTYGMTSAVKASSVNMGMPANSGGNGVLAPQDTTRNSTGMYGQLSMVQNAVQAGMLPAPPPPSEQSEERPYGAMPSVDGSQIFIPPPSAGDIADNEGNYQEVLERPPVRPVSLETVRFEQEAALSLKQMQRTSNSEIFLAPPPGGDLADQEDSYQEVMNRAPAVPAAAMFIPPPARSDHNPVHYSELPMPVSGQDVNLYGSVSAVPAQILRTNNNQNQYY